MAWVLKFGELLFYTSSSDVFCLQVLMVTPCSARISVFGNRNFNMGRECLYIQSREIVGKSQVIEIPSRNRKMEAVFPTLRFCLLRLTRRGVRSEFVSGGGGQANFDLHNPGRYVIIVGING